MPSLRFRTDSLCGDMPTSRTDYILGRNTRSDNRSCSGRSETVPPTNVQYEYGPWRAYIQNRDLQYGFEVDIEGGIYTAWRASEHGSPTWIKPGRVEQQEHSGSTVHSHIETIDTGERRTAFGYTARRVITKNMSRRDSELTSESESDGWYIDAPAAWLGLYPPVQQDAYCILLDSCRNNRDDFTFTRKGERETGFSVLVACVDRSYFRDRDGILRSQESASRNEVTEFSESALDPELFKPRWDFRRVMQLPGGMRYPLANRLRLRWEMLKDSRRLRKQLAA
jgi:hypothetical protein